MRNIRKIAAITVLPLLLIFLFLTAAGAELSTNLQLKTEIYSRSRRIHSQTYVDQFGNAVIADDKGYATVQYTYIESGKTATTEYLDPAGELINCNDGYAKIVNTYRWNKIIKTEYLDADGNPVIGPEGYAVLETKYVEGRHQNTWEYDTEGNPVNLHRITEYGDKDRPGLVTADGWYDTDGNPAAGPDGYARVEYSYRRTMLLRTAYYGPDGKPVFNAKAGFAIKEYTEAYNRYSELNYYGADGELIAGPDGYARATFTYINGDPNVERQMYYNADGSLFFTNKGYCGIQRSYKINRKVTD